MAALLAIIRNETEIDKEEMLEEKQPLVHKRVCAFFYDVHRAGDSSPPKYVDIEYLSASSLHPTNLDVISLVHKVQLGRVPRRFFSRKPSTGDTIGLFRNGDITTKRAPPKCVA